MTPDRKNELSSRLTNENTRISIETKLDGDSPSDLLHLNIDPEAIRLRHTQLGMKVRARDWRSLVAKRHIVPWVVGG